MELVIIGFLIVFVATMWFGLWTDHKKDMALIEKGLYESHHQYEFLKWGIIICSLGIALTVYSIATWESRLSEGPEGPLLPGLTLLCLGTGFIIYHYLTLRRKEKSAASKDSAE